MKGSEFVRLMGSHGQAVWETAAIDAARAGESFIQWSFAPVGVAVGPLQGVFFVACDYFAIGEEDDFLRLPLSAGAAQAIADVFGWQLPTPTMVDAIWHDAPVKVAPHPLPNHPLTLEQAEQHSQIIDVALAGASARLGQLRAGMKKDVVVSDRIRTGKVGIYGWHKLDGSVIQPLSDVHGPDGIGGYVDYSHGIRYIRSDMLVNGESHDVKSVLTDRLLAPLLSRDGPLKTPRVGPTRTNRSAILPASFSPTVPSFPSSPVPSGPIPPEKPSLLPVVIAGSLVVGTIAAAASGKHR